MSSPSAVFLVSSMVRRPRKQRALGAVDPQSFLLTMLCLCSMAGIRQLAQIGGLVALIAGCAPQANLSTQATVPQSRPSATRPYSPIPSTQPAVHSQRKHPLQLEYEEMMERMKRYSPEDPEEWEMVMASLTYFSSYQFEIRTDYFDNCNNIEDIERVRMILRDNMNHYTSGLASMGRAAYRLPSCRDRFMATGAVITLMKGVKELERLIGGYGNMPPQYFVDGIYDLHAKSKLCK